MAESPLRGFKWLNCQMRAFLNLKAAGRFKGGEATDLKGIARFNHLKAAGRFKGGEATDLKGIARFN